MGKNERNDANPTINRDPSDGLIRTPLLKAYILSVQLLRPGTALTPESNSD